MRIFEPKGPIHLERKLDYSYYLGLYLFWRAEDVGIVLGELPYSEKPVHNPTGLVTMHQAELGDSQGKFSI